MASLVALCVGVGISRPLAAQRIQERPSGISEVGIDEKLGRELPLLTEFQTSTGERVSLDRLFDGTRPVILSFHYTDCPMLCKLQLSGLVDGLKELEWTVGEEFRIVSITIDPSETVQQAAAARQGHLQAYGRSVSKEGWSFLVGSRDAIREVTAAAGFHYRYLPEQGEFSHAAAILTCTPDGRIARYLYGVAFDAETLRLSLTEAADGEVGSSLDRLILYCFRYDSEQGKYALAARKIMRVGAIGTVVVLAAFIVPFWLRSRNANSHRERHEVERSSESLSGGGNNE